VFSGRPLGPSSFAFDKDKGIFEQRPRAAADPRPSFTGLHQGELFGQVGLDVYSLGLCQHEISVFLLGVGWSRRRFLELMGVGGETWEWLCHVRIIVLLFCRKLSLPFDWFINRYQDWKPISSLLSGFCSFEWR
jgi:hypothetical protein